MKKIKRTLNIGVRMSPLTRSLFDELAQSMGISRNDVFERSVEGFFSEFFGKDYFEKRRSEFLESAGEELTKFQK